MTDNAEIIARAQRAEKAIEEFIGPALNVLEREYRDRLYHVAAHEVKPAEAIEKLSIAIKVLNEFKSQIIGVVRDGEHAQAEMIRVERFENITAAKRRWL